MVLTIGGGAEWLYWCYAGKAWRLTEEAAEAGRGLDGQPGAHRADLLQVA